MINELFSDTKSSLANNRVFRLIGDIRLPQIKRNLQNRAQPTPEIEPPALQIVMHRGPLDAIPHDIDDGSIFDSIIRSSADSVLKEYQKTKTIALPLARAAITSNYLTGNEEPPRTADVRPTNVAPQEELPPDDMRVFITSAATSAATSIAARQQG